MKVTLAVQLFEDVVFIVSVVDENTLDAWNGRTPDFHLEAIDGAEGEVRECVIQLDVEDLEDLFAVKEIEATFGGAA